MYIAFRLTLSTSHYQVYIIYSTSSYLCRHNIVNRLLEFFKPPSCLRAARRLSVLQDSSLAAVNSTIVIIAIGGVDNGPIAETSIVVVAQCVRVVLAGNKLIQSTHTIDASLASASSQSVQRQDTVVQTHANELVGCVGWVVAILSGVVLNTLLVHSSRVGVGAANDFSNKVTTERCHLGQVEVAVRVRRVLGQTGSLAEVVQRHGSHDTDDDIIVSKVGIEGTIEREVLGVVGDSAVHRAVGHSDVLVCKTGEELLQVANTLGSTSWVAIAVIIVISNVEGLLKTVPLVCGEEVTEVRHSEEASL